MEITKYIRKTGKFNKKQRYFIKNNKIFYSNEQTKDGPEISELFQIIKKTESCNNCKLYLICYCIKNTENEIFYTIDKCIKQGK